MSPEHLSLLWEIAARGGFPSPAPIAAMAKRLKRKSVSVAKIARETVRS